MTLKASSAASKPSEWAWTASVWTKFARLGKSSRIDWPFDQPDQDPANSAARHPLYRPLMPLACMLHAIWRSFWDHFLDSRVQIYRDSWLLQRLSVSILIISLPFSLSIPVSLVKRQHHLVPVYGEGRSHAPDVKLQCETFGSEVYWVTVLRQVGRIIDISGFDQNTSTASTPQLEGARAPAVQPRMQVSDDVWANLDIDGKMQVPDGSNLFPKTSKGSAYPLELHVTSCIYPCLPERSSQDSFRKTLFNQSPPLFNVTKPSECKMASKTTKNSQPAQSTTHFRRSSGHERHDPTK